MSIYKVFLILKQEMLLKLLNLVAFSSFITLNISITSYLAQNRNVLHFFKNKGVIPAE